MAGRRPGGDWPALTPPSPGPPAGSSGNAAGSPGKPPVPCPEPSQPSAGECRPGWRRGRGAAVTSGACWPQQTGRQGASLGGAAFCGLRLGGWAVLKASSESPEAALPQAPLSHGRSSGKGGSLSAWIPPCPPSPSAHLLVGLHERGPGLHDVVADGALAQGCRLVQAGLPTGGTGAGCGPHPVLWALLSPQGPSEGAGSVGSWGRAGSGPEGDRCGQEGFYGLRKDPHRGAR